MTAGNNQHRSLRITDDVFCDAPDERVLQSSPTVSRSDDEINLRVACRGADFVDRGTRESFRLDGQTAQKIHLFERVHFLPGCFFHRFGQPGQTDAGAVNEHVVRIWIHRVEQAQRGVKILCQKRRVFRRGERTLREICWNQDGADGECFAVGFRFLFSFPRNKYRARRVANDSFRRAPEQKMLESAVSSRRKRNQIRIDLAGQMDDLLERASTAGVAILRTKSRYVFAMNTGQLLVKPFDRLG